MKRSLCVLSCLVAVVGMTGCSTMSMKGTPFYKGEYTANIGDASDRVNLWPVLYYREPALSLLWPIFEYSDDHFAARPLVSYYGRGTDHRELNLLWPLASFHPDRNEQHVFPFFWGDDYLVGFPLYYQFDEPFEGNGSTTLFPLWSYSARSSGKSLHLLWPVGHWSNRKNREGWRVWPLAGSYNHYGDRYRFAAWPLGHAWQKRDGVTGGHMLLPLYYRDRTADEERFYSLPYSRGSRTNGDHWSVLLPLYYRDRTADEERFYSLPYSRGSRTNGDQWRVVLPLWYSQTTGDVSEWGSLLGGWRRTPTETNTVVLPALSWSQQTELGRDTRLLLGLGRIDRAGQAQGSHLFPLYKHETTDDSSLFLSLPYSHAVRTDGSSWRFIPPVWYSRTEANGEQWRLTLFYGDRKRADGSYAWRALVPFIYSREDPNDQLVATLLGGYRCRGDRSDWFALPLLAGGRHAPENNELWYLAGLGHAAWGKRSDGRQWLVPFYYSEASSQILVSPLYCRWAEAGTTSRAIPPALTWWDRSGDELHARTLAGLAGWDRFRGKTEASYLFPIYSYHKDDHFLTLLAGHKYGNDGFSYMATPLIGSWHGDTRGEWIFPIWDRQYDLRRDVHSMRLLWGHYTRKGTNSVSSSFFPLYGYRHEPRQNFLKGGDRMSTHFWCLPICWYDHSEWTRTGSDTEAETRARTSSGVFPLYYYRRQGSEKATGSRLRLNWNLLWRLYDYHAEHDAPTAASVEATSVSAQEGPEIAAHDYTRSRVLWRVYHRETLDGAATTDIFPGIVFDRAADGRRSWSVLWRLLAYEREEDGSRRMHLLFIPIRTRGAE